MILVRHGLMIIGEAISGKTSAYKALAKTLGQLADQKLLPNEYGVTYDIINPKSITMGQLYGRFDPISHEWFDGVLASIFREHSTSVDPDRKWIVFDGPVDAVWIENMNTVLDDNKKLCLMSGEIIKMSSKQNMLFEPKDLEMASPATVSRCGMIYLDPNIIGVKSLMRAWLNNNLPKEIIKSQAVHIEQLCDWLIAPCLDFVLKKCDQYLSCTRMHLTMSFLKLFECMLDDMAKSFDDTTSLNNETDNENEEALEDGDDEESPLSVSDKKIAQEKLDMITAYFFMSIIWSIGITLKKASREKFNGFFLELCENLNGKYPKPKSLTFQRSVLVPKRFTIYDYTFVKKHYGAWSTWASLTESVTIPPTVKPNEVMITTTETTRQMFFLNKLMHANKMILFVGPTGTGKTSMINSYLHQLSKESFLLNSLNFSARTTASQTQDIILSKMTR